ncbi:MAG: TetR/AcrR family transcriptional regulator [Solirubrobacterales bacterium]
MVVTPWGNSDSLRERRLRPGPGVPREDVVRNQRERLFGAMVASVYERGYAATTVNDLVQISGVSSRTFYDLFPDKQACFVAALQGIIEAAVSYATRNLAEPQGEQSWEEVARRGFDAFATMIAAQPAAAKMALIEAHAAGPEALVPVEGAIAGFEWMTRQMLDQSPERADMPAELVTAHIGAQQEIARTRLRRGTERELPQLADQVWELVSSFRPPPQPLRLVGRPPKPEPESLAAHDHAERALRAFTAVVTEKGYEEATIDDVLKRAQMSATTFYAHFNGKEDAMLAAIDTACAQAIAAMVPAFARHDEWLDGIRAAYGAILNFLTSRPGLARLLAVDVYAAGAAAVERRDLGLQPLDALIANNTAAWPMMPPIVYETIRGAFNQLLYKTVRDSGPEGLPHLAPVCTYFTLFPFVGAEVACAAANGPGAEGRPATKRQRAAAHPHTTPFQPTVTRSLSAALSLLSERSTDPDTSTATPAEIAAEIDEDVVVVRSFLLELAATGVVEVVAGKPGAGGEPSYRSLSRLHPLQTVSIQQSAMMSRQERQALNSGVWDLIVRDVAKAFERGSYDERLDSVLLRTPLRLDEQGWRELGSLHEQTLYAGFEIQARSEKRLKESGEDGFEARSIQIAFELPGETDGSQGGGSD